MGKGKYAGIVEQLPRSLGTEPDYQDKINAIKAKILEPESDSTTEEDRGELTSAVVEEMALDISATLSVLNDMFIRAVGGEGIHASRLARIYRDLRVVKRLFEEQEKTTNILLEAYGQILIDQYEAEGTTSLKLDDGAAVRIQYEPHATVVDREANRRWAMENGLENLLSLPWQTCNALTKEALINGVEPPAGIEATTRVKIVYSKG